MTSLTDGDDRPPEELFSPSAQTRIAQLALCRPDSRSSTYIEAEVSLLWPYSSKTGELSLLLADLDVRRRSAKGQLKVTFHGPGAREVARSKVGIGDIVKLHLAQAEWTNTGDAVSTPGKKVDWDLHLKNQVILDVRRNGTNLATINYDRVLTLSPTPNEIVTLKNELLQINEFSDDSSIIFYTPVSTLSKRVPVRSFIDASLDPFADDDGFVVGKGRKRTRFGRNSGSWRLVDEGVDNEQEEEQPTSPEDSTTKPDQVHFATARTNGAPNVIVLDDSSSSNASPIETTMPPPSTPFRRPERPRESITEGENASTPRLYPLASPGLPLVSPLIKNVGASIGYFDMRPSTTSELDAISISSTTPQERAFSTGTDFGKTGPDEMSRDKEQVVEDAQSQSLESQLGPVLSDDNASPSPAFNGSFGSQLGPQPPVIGSKATASPFGSSFENFAGFDIQRNTQFAFGGPPTSSGSSTGFASLGNLFGFSSTAGFGTGVGLEFGTPSSPHSENSFAANNNQIVSQNAFAALVHEEHTVEDHSTNDLKEAPDLGNENPATIDKEPRQSPIVQQDLHTLRRERSQSEQAENDDMYGPARPMRRSASVASVASGRSASLQHNWENSFDVTAVDTKTGKLSSQPFPFVQNLHKKGPKPRRSSQHSQFLDGATDDMSEDEESQSRPSTATSSDGELPRISPARDEVIEHVHPVDWEVTSLESLVDVEVIQNFESLTRAYIAADPMLESEGVLTQMQTKQLDNVHEAQTAHDLTTTEPDQEEPGVAHTVEEDRTMEELVDEDSQSEDQNRPSLAMREPLLTPNNTQQDLTGAPSLESIQHVPSLQMPPTPDNTQEPAHEDTLQFDGTNDLYSIMQKESNEEVPLPEAENTEKLPSHSHRKAVNVQAVSSPYFSSRRSPRLSPERQTLAVAQAKAQQDENTRPASPDPDHAMPVEMHAMQEEVLGPPIDKKHRALLGMVTPVSYYTPLPNLFEHFNHEVDVLAVCKSSSEEPVRSKSGPKDYNVTLHLADSFLNGATAIAAQIFRPYKRALPIVERGQVVLLRAFKVQSQKRKMMLLSTDSSAWAVFSSTDLPAKDVQHYDLQVKTPGPPVEYGSEEYVYAKKLMEWWDSEGIAVHSDSPSKRGEISLATKEINSVRTPANLSRTTRSSRHNDNRTDNGGNGAQQEPSVALSPVFEPTSPKSTPPSRRKTNRTVKDANGNEPAEVTLAHPSSPAPPTRSSRRLRNRTDNVENYDDPDILEKIEPLMPSPKARRRPRQSFSTISATPEPPRSLRSQSVVHELRDGTKYVDGHVPTKNDGMHELRDRTKYVDENVSSVGKAPIARERSVVHELRDGTKYVDLSKSPEVRRSTRNKRD